MGKDAEDSEARVSMRVPRFNPTKLNYLYIIYIYDVIFLDTIIILKSHLYAFLSFTVVIS